MTNKRKINLEKIKKHLELYENDSYPDPEEYVTLVGDEVPYLIDALEESKHLLCLCVKTYISSVNNDYYATNKFILDCKNLIERLS